MHVKDKAMAEKWACWETWPRAAESYSSLIGDSGRDSRYLREKGLEPNLLRMVGDCSEAPVLDAGCGTGWLLEKLCPGEGYACDIVKQPGIAPEWNFEIQDVRSLLYPDDSFDVVVASLLLMWFSEVDRALRELFRVTKPGGKTVIALVHPYFYRTGHPGGDGAFVLSEDLSKPFRIDDLEIGGVAGPVTYFYRPFPDYLNACAKAGFRIREVLDWFLDMEDYLRNVKNGMDSDILRTGKVPLYSFIECGKD